MQYDPIKRSLGNLFNRTPWLRKRFYNLLDLLLLRTWHVKKDFRFWAKQHRTQDDIHILDAGSGFGQYTYFMSRFNSNWNITGIDIKQEQINDCNRFFKSINKNNCHFQKGDLTQYAVPKHYNFILSVDVMEHILEDVEVFKNFHTSLQPGGMVIISTPSDQGGSDAHHHDHEHADNSSFIDEHVRDGYNIKKIQEKLKEAGFTHTEARYTYGTPGKLSWKLSMKYPILMLGASKSFFILLPFYYLIIFPIALILNKLDTSIHHHSGTGLLVKAWK